MSRRPPTTLHDLCELYGAGHMLVRCANPHCQRSRIFHVREIRDHWKVKRWSDRWRDLPQHFYCALCLSRPEPLQWIENIADDHRANATFACLAPFGINARAWALAGPSDRERLIKSRR